MPTKASWVTDGTAASPAGERQQLSLCDGACEDYFALCFRVFLRPFAPEAMAKPSIFLPDLRAAVSQRDLNPRPAHGARLDAQSIPRCQRFRGGRCVGCGHQGERTRHFGMKVITRTGPGSLGA
jgi:hypothetical protein